MRYNPDIHHRRSIRLKGYDYSRRGAYFITICAQDRRCLFGEVAIGEMRLNDMGRLLDFTWHDLINHNNNIGLDGYVIMPNHFHGILWIVTDGKTGADGVPVGAGSEPAPTGTPSASAHVTGFPSMTPSETPPTEPRRNHGLPEIIRQLKTFSARRINELRQTPGVAVWQRNYYEHIIRNERELERIREYIIQNPRHWERDRNNPMRESRRLT